MDLKRDGNGNLVDSFGNVIQRVGPSNQPTPLQFGERLKVSVGGKTVDGFFDGSNVQINKK